MSSKKRKRPRRESQGYESSKRWTKENTQNEDISQTVFVEAHEATIIRNRPDLAQAVKEHSEDGRGGLIELNDRSIREGKRIWVDRFDARLLIEPNSSLGQSETNIPSSPTGWSDLPSDTEDTFFLNREEVEDTRWQKHRRMLDTAMEERMRAMEEAASNTQNSEDEDTQERWGDDDEEPEDAIKTLMERTASHLVASPNGAQLEMRILANHGTDPRFAFLRGRWKNAWRRIKAVAQSQKKVAEREATEEATQSSAVTGLVVYDSESD